MGGKKKNAFPGYWKGHTDEVGVSVKMLSNARNKMSN